MITEGGQAEKPGAVEGRMSCESRSSCSEVSRERRFLTRTANPGLGPGVADQRGGTL